MMYSSRYIHIYVYTYIYIYVCVYVCIYMCVCVCVCAPGGKKMYKICCALSTEGKNIVVIVDFSISRAHHRNVELIYY